MDSPLQLKCLVIENDVSAIETLEHYIDQISFLKLSGVAQDVYQAIELVNSSGSDVVFLDIHLFKSNGLDLRKSLIHHPQLIFTTAHHQYAVDAFEEGITDYLMKPVEFSRFLKAVNKLKLNFEKRKYHQSILTSRKNKRRPYIFFNVNKKKRKIYFDDIIYVESLKDYSKIVTRHSSFVIRGNIGEIENQFKNFRFLRIHRSFMISIDQIYACTSSEIEIDGHSLPIGRSYKEHVSKVLNQYLLDS